ncbi:MAG TPA: hypothetical protein PKZ83_12695 [bacterium]|nr:hypothetical protein [bacterium]
MYGLLKTLHLRAFWHSIGREARLRGKDMLLGPALNIQRLPAGCP